MVARRSEPLVSPLRVHRQNVPVVLTLSQMQDDGIANAPPGDVIMTVSLGLNSRHTIPKQTLATTRTWALREVQHSD